MKFNWKKFLWINHHLPKTSYILRTFVGFYMMYIVYSILNGLKEPNVTNPALVIVSAVIFSFFCVFFLVSGCIGLYKKEYKEAYEDEKSNTMDETFDDNELKQDGKR